MRVATYRADSGACGMLRLGWPTAELARHGADVTDRHAGRFHGIYAAGGRLVDVKHPDADVVVFQRPTQRWFAEAIPLLQRHGVAVVVEIDDLFTHADPRNAAAPGFHPQLSPDRNWQHLAKAAKLADMVTVSTPALAEHYGGHGRVRVIPNQIPRAWLNPGCYDQGSVSQAADECKPHPDRAWVANGPLCRRHLARHLESARAEGAQAGNNCSPGGPPQKPRETGASVVVGWSGSTHTHPADLQVTRTGIQAALTQADARMHVIGTGDGVRDALRLTDEPTATGWVELDAYPRALAEVTGDAITPLADTLFNKCKSWVTPLAWAGAGVPVVMSPLPEYQAAHKRGIGVLARKPRDWTRELVRLLTDPAWAAEVTGRGREAAAGMTIEDNCADVWSAWETAAKNRARRGAA